MLISRLVKKYPKLDKEQTAFVEQEVAYFVKNEVLSKESMRLLELKV
jgi:hypothetical protein